MSKIGKMPIQVPQGVSVDISGRNVVVKGPNGELKHTLVREIEVSLKDNALVVTPKSKSKFAQAMYGTTRAHLFNLVQGVTNGWKKELELVGTGYRASVNGKKLILNIGFSHPVEFDPPEGISFVVEKSTVTVNGIDKHLVGQIAANIRKVRPPEPYKGKGIRYKDEYVRRKPGKAAKAAGAA